ncbi:MAG: hypothetical protein AAB381_01170 [Patescibacteria group bacterium]
MKKIENAKWEDILFKIGGVIGTLGTQPHEFEIEFIDNEFYIGDLEGGGNRLIFRSPAVSKFITPQGHGMAIISSNREAWLEDPAFYQFIFYSLDKKASVRRMCKITYARSERRNVFRSIEVGEMEYLKFYKFKEVKDAETFMEATLLYLKILDASIA